MMGEISPPPPLTFSSEIYIHPLLETIYSPFHPLELYFRSPSSETIQAYQNDMRVLVKTSIEIDVKLLISSKQEHAKNASTLIWQQGGGDGRGVVAEHR